MTIVGGDGTLAVNSSRNTVASRRFFVSSVNFTKALRLTQADDTQRLEADFDKAL